MVTADVTRETRERALRMGAKDFLTKPVNKLELLTRTRSLLRVRLLKRRIESLMKERRGAQG